MDARQNFFSQKMGLWCVAAFVALTVVGWLGIGQFITPFPADGGAEATKLWYTETHRMGIIVGCSLFYIACGFLVPASIQFGVMLSKIEGRFPLWSITTAVSGIFISLIVFLNSCAWIAAAYRPEAGADVIQAWTDWSWFAFLLGWVYLTLEMLASAVVEFGDQREQPMIPRWFTWLTLVGAVSLVTAAGPAFFKSGPFAYHGLLGFYMPVFIWGVYLVGTGYFMYRELQREEAAEKGGQKAGGAHGAAVGGASPQPGMRVQ